MNCCCELSGKKFTVICAAHQALCDGDTNKLTLQNSEVAKERDDWKRAYEDAVKKIGEWSGKAVEIQGEKAAVQIELKESSRLYREVMEAAGDLMYPKRTDSAEPYMRLKSFVDDFRKSEEVVCDSCGCPHPPPVCRSGIEVLKADLKRIDPVQHDKEKCSKVVGGGCECGCPDCVRVRNSY